MEAFKKIEAFRKIDFQKNGGFQKKLEAFKKNLEAFVKFKGCLGRKLKPFSKKNLKAFKKIWRLADKFQGIQEKIKGSLGKN